MSAAIFAAEAKLRPIIESLSVIPPAVTVMQGQSATASVSAVANSAVGGVRYSLGDAPNWLTLDNDVIIMEPTDNDSSSVAVTVTAYDTGSSAQAYTVFYADANVEPKILSLQLSNNYPLATLGGEPQYVTMSATTQGNCGAITYSLSRDTSYISVYLWLKIEGNRLFLDTHHTEGVDSLSNSDYACANYTVTATASNDGTSETATIRLCMYKAPTTLSITPANKTASENSISTRVTITANAEYDEAYSYLPSLEAYSNLRGCW